MKVATLQGVSRYITFKLGSHTFMGVDLVQVISDFKKISKSDAKRIITSGGVDATFKVDEIKESDIIS